MAVIFWFSGTGNSLYAAKKLAGELGGADLVRITDEVPAGPYGGEGEKVGFVVPSYYCNMPRAAQFFIEKLNILPGTYVFGIVTMGGAGQGTVDALAKAIKAKGLNLNYGRCVLMPANYIIKYNPADKNKVDDKLAKIDSSLKGFADDIKAGAEKVKGFPYNGKSLYKNVSSLDKGFTSSEKCTGCDICEKVCPVGNIKLEDGRPKWLGHCERCMACISLCPAGAIDYDTRTKGRRRYQNPNININELKR